MQWLTYEWRRHNGNWDEWLISRFDQRINDRMIEWSTRESVKERNVDRNPYFGETFNHCATIIEDFFECPPTTLSMIGHITQSCYVMCISDSLAALRTPVTCWLIDGTIHAFITPTCDSRLACVCLVMGEPCRFCDDGRVPVVSRVCGVNATYSVL